MEDEERWRLDNGTPLYALGELRRHMGSGFDSTAAELLGAVDRAGSAIVQADSAKTVQEEVRHLVRALAAAAQVYVLAAARARGVLDEVRPAAVAGSDPAVAGLLAVVDRAHSAIIQADGGKTVQDEVRHLVRALAAAAQVYAIAAARTRVALDEARRAGR